jgi:hypothetical protein
MLLAVRNLRTAFVATITCADRARGFPLDRVSDRHYPRYRTGRGLCTVGKGFGKTMYSVYALIYIVAAALVVTVAFLVVTALMP